MESLAPLLIEQLDQGKEVTFLPGGVSMRPFLRGDRDRVVLFRPSRYRVNDIVLFRRNDGRYSLHRLYRIDGKKRILCGDALIRRDEPVTSDHLLAAVKGFYRGDRYIDCRKNRGYRFLSNFWRILFPVRRIVVPIGRQLHLLFSFIPFRGKRKKE